MNDREILDRLWEAHRETPFATFSLQRKLDLRHDDLRAAINLINDMAESGEVRSGYRIKRVASTVYKMTQAQQNDGDSPKGLPLTEAKESLTEANTASFTKQDAEIRLKTAIEKEEWVSAAAEIHIACRILTGIPEKIVEYWHSNFRSGQVTEMLNVPQWLDTWYDSQEMLNAVDDAGYKCYTCFMKAKGVYPAELVCYSGNSDAEEMRQRNCGYYPVLGQPERSFPSTDGENADFSINDPFPAVPAELKALRQWVCWRKETTRDGKPTKIPYQVNRRKAQSNQADTWTDYQTVCDHLDNFSGIGFVFSEDDPYCGIDLDDCLDAQGELKDWAKPIVDRIKGVGYGERSPSGNGIKFWTRATLPPEAKHKVHIVKDADAIEAYDRLRYFTVTGRGKGDIGDGQAVIDWLVQEHLSEPQRPTHTTDRQPSATENLNAGEVIERIRASKKSAKFDALMAGNTTGYGSQSDADLGLCGVIKFWSQETAVIDTIFRQSALMRAKWDERRRGDGATYGQMTIEKALSGNRETYTQPRPARTTNKRHARRERYGYDRF